MRDIRPALWGFFLILPLPLHARADEDPKSFDCAQLPQLQASANSNDSEALFKLSLLYSNGRCVEKDTNKGGSLLGTAARLGNTKAQITLALMLSKCNCGQENVAASLAQKAAEKGNALAQGVLAGFYNHGDGIAQSYEEAAKWAKRSANQGNKIGQIFLSLFLHNGYGVPKDDIESEKWALIIEKQDQNSLEVLGRKVKEMNLSAVEIAEAKRRADAWKPVPEEQK
jgi:TPR repeat protein